MSQTSLKPFNLVCVSSDFKGNPFLAGAKERNCHVTLVTKLKHSQDAWLRDAVDDFHFVGDDSTPDDYLRTVVWLARHRRVDHVVGLDEFDVLPTAQIREFLQINRGLNVSQATLFRDKLAMRFAAARAGIPQPEFVPLFNLEDVLNYANRINPPWIIKPRNEVSAFWHSQTRKCNQLWATLLSLIREQWRDHSSQFCSRNCARQSFHVDSFNLGVHLPIFSGTLALRHPYDGVTHHGGVLHSLYLMIVMSDTSYRIKRNLLSF
jgi:hypothetical protein